MLASFCVEVAVVRLKKGDRISVLFLANKLTSQAFSFYIQLS